MYPRGKLGILGRELGDPDIRSEAPVKARRAAIASGGWAKHKSGDGDPLNPRDLTR